MKVSDVRIPATQTSAYILKGGLDQQTPAMAVDAGKVIDAQNYAPDIAGGYRRIDGYERFDGRAAPSGASYWVLSAALTTSIAAGATVTGATTLATARVLGVFGTTIVLCRIAGTFIPAEQLKVGVDVVGVSASGAQINAAAEPSDDADYRLLAANDLRADILAVPGSGPIRGVYVYNDTVYAFRDNAGATAGLVYKQSAGGWTAVALGTEIQFTNAIGEIFDEDTIIGNTSGATAVVSRALLRTGTWAAAGEGTLVIVVTSGSFVSGELLTVGAATKATTATNVTPIARLPGGRLEAVTANFSGSLGTRRMYGADGVNFAFEFDGTVYAPIRTGMPIDAPDHITEHRAYLFLSFGASVQYSGVNDPYAWTAILGAGEIALGSDVEGFQQLTGSTAGAALAVFTVGKLNVLYGTPGTADFQNVPSGFDLGFAAYTCQPVGSEVWGLTARGIHNLTTTRDYGDFSFAAISFLIQPLLSSKIGKSLSSYTDKARAHYKLFFSDGTGVVLGLTGNKPNGAMPLNYGRPVRCVHSTTLSTGQEVCYFGSDDGFIYRDNIGTSFDGAPVPAWCRPVFNNLQSPQVRKQFRFGVFQVKTEGFAQLQISDALGYGTPQVAPSDVNPVPLDAMSSTWNQFMWAGQALETPRVTLSGSETNISFLLYSNRAQDKPTTLQGVILGYTPRRLQRGS